MKKSLYLVGKPEICKVLTHLFNPNNYLNLSSSVIDLNSFLKENIPANSITIIVLSNKHRTELPSAYYDGEKIVSCLLLDTVEEASQWVELQKKLLIQHKSNTSILAQWHPLYLKQGNAWLEASKEFNQFRVNNWMADKVGKSRLLDYLQKSIQTCIYFGHGRSQKIVGYHGVSAQEITQVNSVSPISFFLSFSCYHLSHDNQQDSFGEVLIKSNNVSTFFGSRIATDKRLNAKFIKICQAEFFNEENITISDWLNSIGIEIEKQKSASLCLLWESYSLLGNPLQTLK